MWLRLFIAMAVVVFSTAACEQAIDEAFPSPMREIAIPSVSPPATPEMLSTTVLETTVSSISPTPTSALLHGAQASVEVQGLENRQQQVLLWHYDLFNDPVIAGTRDWWIKSRDSDYRRVVLAVNCARDLERAEQMLQERLPQLGIPLDAVMIVIEAQHVGNFSIDGVPLTPRSDCAMTEAPRLIHSPTPPLESVPTRTPSITFVPSQRIAPSATNERTATPDTWPPPTSTPQHFYGSQQLEEWYALALEPSLPWIWGSYVRHEEGFIGLYTSCENKVENTLQALEALEIPSVVIRIEVIKRPRHDVLPPPPPIFECVPPEVVDPVNGASQPGFGGLYVEYEVATIFLLEPSQELGESLVHDELGNAGFDELKEVRVLKGEYTWDQLLEWHQSIQTYRPETIQDGTDDINWGQVLLNPRNNRITINVIPPKGVWTEGVWFVRSIEDALLKLGVPREAVIFVNEYE